MMTGHLHVTPGTATPLALINDPYATVTLIVDQRLVDEPQLNFHPMTQTESIRLSWVEFVAFRPPVAAIRKLVVDLTT